MIKILIWVLRIVAAAILLQTLRFKFTADPQSVYIFTKIGLEPYGRIGTGILELLASLLLFVPRATGIGASLAAGLMGGAIYFHLTTLGIEVDGDSGLFMNGIIVFIASLTLMIIYRQPLLTFAKQLLKGKLVLQGLALLLIGMTFINCSSAQNNTTMNNEKNKYYSTTENAKLNVSNEEWKKNLDPETYQIAREKGTEYAFSGKFWNHFETGLYRCKACGNALFRSNGKFESSCGWPSFFEPISETSLTYADDRTHGMIRTEVKCGRCDAHLGHVFDDGPAPTYKRYCINSVILDFEGEKTSALPKAGGAANRTDTATFGAGCFWCVEAQLMELNGVLEVQSGYSGGHVKNPSYREVCTGTTGHAEVVRVVFNPSILSYDELLAAFWQSHDPTQLNRQGNDVGTQYRSVIFYYSEQQKEIAEKYKAKLNQEKVYDDPVVTEISPMGDFYKAEDYHQNYYNENSNQGYCQFVIAPKLEKFRKVFKDKLKK